MIDIYIDADACPVKDEVIRVATRYSLEVYVVSNSGMRVAMGQNIHLVVVGKEFDAADHWIAERAKEYDIVITADIQLASRCLQKKAEVLNHNGKPFTSNNIGSALALRELNSYLREAGEIKGFNPAFSKKDRSQFLQTLDTLIQRIKRNAGL